MPDVEETMGVGGCDDSLSTGAPGSDGASATESLTIPVCHLNLEAIGLTDGRVDAIWECIAIVYTLRVPTTERSSGGELGKSVSTLLRHFYGMYPLVDHRGEKEKKEKPILTWCTKSDLLDAARWLDAKRLLSQLDEEIASFCQNAIGSTNMSFNPSCEEHQNLAEAVALSDEFGLSRAWNTILQHFRGASRSGHRGFLKDILTHELSPASTRLSTDAKLALALCAFD